MARKKSERRSPLQKRMVDFREKHDLTQEAAAARLGVTRRVWIKWETEGSEPEPAYLFKLEAFLSNPENFPG